MKKGIDHMQVTKYRVVKVVYGLKGEATHTFFINHNGNRAYANPQRDACLLGSQEAAYLAGYHQKESDVLTERDGRVRKVWTVPVTYLEADNDNCPLT